MRHYEAMLILEGNADDEVINAGIRLVEDNVNSASGKINSIDKWGRKRLAYEINRRAEGNYNLVKFQANPSAIAEVDRALLLSDDIIRYKIVHIPDAVAVGAKSASKTANKASKAQESGK